MQFGGIVSAEESGTIEKGSAMSDFLGDKGLLGAYIPRRNWRRTLLWIAGALIFVAAVAKAVLGQPFV
jgi:hypothetical protein